MYRQRRRKKLSENLFIGLGPYSLFLPWNKSHKAAHFAEFGG